MRRPLPSIPRGPRRPRPSAAPRALLACPKVSPEWELAALRALTKPQTKGAILHRSGTQHWPADGAERAALAERIVRERLGDGPRVHCPPAGDFFLVADVDKPDAPPARALALVLSRALPGVWLTLGRWSVRDGQFFRRERRFGWKWTPATDVHLPREVRAALRDVL